jgi:hypothetical protein
VSKSGLVAPVSLRTVTVENFYTIIQKIQINENGTIRFLRNTKGHAISLQKPNNNPNSFAEMDIKCEHYVRGQNSLQKAHSTPPVD